MKDGGLAIKKEFLEREREGGLVPWQRENFRVLRTVARDGNGILQI